MHFQSSYSIKSTYPFGMEMKGRSYEAGKYKYGFNTQEKDDEPERSGAREDHLRTKTTEQIYGEGNSTSAEFWQYDGRLGRRWNVDPVIKTWESSYATFANNPLIYIDINGDDVINGWKDLRKNAEKKLTEKSAEIDNQYGTCNVKNKRKFIKSGGTKDEWKTYKKLNSEKSSIASDLKLLKKLEANTDKIISKFEAESPNLFALLKEGVKDANGVIIDLILYGTDEMDVTTKGQTHGYGVPSSIIRDEKVVWYSPTKKLDFGRYATSPVILNSFTIFIASNVQLDFPDIVTKQYSLTHEIVHFLFTIFEGQGIYNAAGNKENGIAALNLLKTNGGHGNGNKSGITADEFGKNKDLKLEEILKIISNVMSIKK